VPPTPSRCEAAHRLTGNPCVLPKSHQEAHRDYDGVQFGWNETSHVYYCVYGLAHLTEAGFMLVPRRLPGATHPEDAELFVEGVRAEGDTAVGIVDADGVPFVVNTNWDPSPEPPGNWQKREVGRWKARWAVIPRRPVWEHLDQDPFAPEPK